MEDIPGSGTSTDHMLDMAENLVAQCKKIIDSADEYFQPKMRLEAFRQFSREHPAAAVFLSMLVAMSIIPVACFCTFAVCMTLIILASCLFFEGWHSVSIVKQTICRQANLWLVTVKLWTSQFTDWTSARQNIRWKCGVNNCSNCDFCYNLLSVS